MKLKSLDIEIISTDDYRTNVKNIISGNIKSFQHQNLNAYQSIELFKKIMTPNKLQILMAISRLKPVSINQLSKFLVREYPHVFNDCKSLEAEGFIHLEEQDGLRKQLKPKLIFDFDIIRVKAPIEEIYSISERANKVLLSEARL